MQDENFKIAEISEKKNDGFVKKNLQEVNESAMFSYKCWHFLFQCLFHTRKRSFS